MLSIVACYGTLAFVMIFSLFGITISVHEGAWAAVIVVFSWLAVVAMGVSYRHHRGMGPVIVSAIGALLITWVMLVAFNRIEEVLGFAALIVAALWDRYLRGRAKAARLTTA